MQVLVALLINANKVLLNALLFRWVMVPSNALNSRRSFLGALLTER
jgi:hypothetical protein